MFPQQFSHPNHLRFSEGRCRYYLHYHSYNSEQWSDLPEITQLISKNRGSHWERKTWSACLGCSGYKNGRRPWNHAVRMSLWSSSCTCDHGSRQGVILPPREDLSKFEDISGCHNLGQRCYWHLAGRDQGCCLRTYSMQDNLHNKELFRDFIGGPVVRNSLCNAGDAGLIPGWRTKILCAAEQLSPWAATTEPSQHNKRSHMTQLRPHTAK